jgi:hypothetical protein
MRRTIQFSLLLLLSTLATVSVAQSNSPEALYDRGIDAITGVGPSEK